MIRSVRVDQEDVIALIRELDAFQVGLYGRELCSLDSPTALSNQRAKMFGAFFEASLVGIAAVKLKESYAELKRMYIKPEFRRMGLARQLVVNLESYAAENNKELIRLETGMHQHAAIKFYMRQGYKKCERFGEYSDEGISVFMEKYL